MTLRLLTGLAFALALGGCSGATPSATSPAPAPASTSTSPAASTPAPTPTAAPAASASVEKAAESAARAAASKDQAAMATWFVGGGLTEARAFAAQWKGGPAVLFEQPPCVPAAENELYTHKRKETPEQVCTFGAPDSALLAYMGLKRVDDTWRVVGLQWGMTD